MGLDCFFLCVDSLRVGCIVVSMWFAVLGGLIGLVDVSLGVVLFII